jgi:teichuronic acid biosynthesis glycosyltransferase TuaG
VPTPLVSIITPSYNSMKYIEATIISVLGQTMSNWEMIIVDDCSTDGTQNLVKLAIAEDNRIILMENEKNIGQGLTRNRAIKAAQGRFIAFLDSDDVWTPNKLEVQLSAMESLGVALSHTAFGYINQTGEIIKSPLHVSKEPINYKDLLRRTEIGCLTVVYDTDIVGKMYMPDLPRSQDYALWLSILKQGHKSLPIDEVLAYYRIHDSNISKNKWKKIPFHWAVLRDHEELGLIKSAWYTFLWATNGLVRYFIK